MRNYIFYPEKRRPDNLQNNKRKTYIVHSHKRKTMDYMPLTWDRHKQNEARKSFFWCYKNFNQEYVQIHNV